VGPFYTAGALSPTESQKREGRADGLRRIKALALRQIEVSELARELQAAHNHPDRMEYARIFAAWAHQVDAIAFTKGSQIETFVGRVRDLLSQRDEAVELDDESEVRSAERLLNKLTGVAFPQLPAAAYEAAALLPAAERDEEMARLDVKYATPAAAATNGTKPAKTRRLATRALTTTGAPR
jgi:hypothetical protein